MIEWVGPTGRTIIGNARDERKSSVQNAIQMYDPLLYIKWNPKKREGYGTWEIRRRPERKTLIDCGGGFYFVDYRELNIIAHVLDTPVLNAQEILKQLHRMDSWSTHGKEGKGWSKEREYKAALINERIEKSAAEELRHNIKEHKREWKDLLAAVSRKEIHPAQLFQGMDLTGRQIRRNKVYGK